MKIFKSALCLLLCALFVSTTVLVSVIGVSAAETEPPTDTDAKYKQLLVLGDSISTGYGLDKYVAGSTPYLCASYGNLIAKELGFTGGSDYINRAVNGDKTTDLLALLPSLKGTVEKSDLILISIGGNDLLSLVPVVASTITGKTVTTYEQAANILMALGENALPALQTNETIQAKMSAALLGFGLNLTQIIAMLKTYNPSARVIFLEQYNPMANISQVATFNKFADPLLKTLNASMRTIVTAAGYETADTPSVINENADIMTNITMMDIHPNDAGHAVIAQLISDMLKNSEPAVTTAEPETTLPETTAAPETTAEITTDAPETAAPADGGCGSSAVTLIPMLVILPLALPLVRRKH